MQLFVICCLLFLVLFNFHVIVSNFYPLMTYPFFFLSQSYLVILLSFKRCIRMCFVFLTITGRCCIFLQNKIPFSASFCYVFVSQAYIFQVRNKVHTVSGSFSHTYRVLLAGDSTVKLIFLTAEAWLYQGIKVLYKAICRNAESSCDWRADFVLSSVSFYPDNSVIFPQWQLFAEVIHCHVKLFLCFRYKTGCLSWFLNEWFHGLVLV